MCHFKKRIGLLALLRLLGHFSWLPFGVRRRLITLAYDSEYAPSQPFEVEFFGNVYPGDLNCYLDWHVYFFGAYEQQSLFFLRDLLSQSNRKQEAVFVDIGANVGQHTLFMSNYARAVHSFEPWDVVRNSLYRKIERNQLTNVTVHPVGLGDKHDHLTFHAPLGSNTGTGSFCDTCATDRNRSAGRLEVAVGDEEFERCGISHIDVVKIDVEGWEKFVLLGLRNTLTRDKPTVFMEVSQSTLETFEGLDEFLRCVPDCYEALYVSFTRKGVRYSPFDATRPGDVLLRARP